jgi:DNA polymerase III epsilon subunit-like protein
LLPGAVIRQETYWTVARVDETYAYLTNYPRTADCVAIPIEIEDLVRKGIIDPPKGKLDMKSDTQKPVAEPKPESRTAESDTSRQAIAIDVETGGTSVSFHALLSVGACVFDLDTGETFDEIEVRMRPHGQLQIHPASTNIHGITYLSARSEPSERESLGKLHVWLKQYSDLKAWEHSNSGFDRKFLEAAYERQASGKRPPVAGWDNLWPYNSKRKDKQRMGLDALGERYGLPARGVRHGALDDAKRLALIISKFLGECKAQGSLV